MNTALWTTEKSAAESQSGVTTEVVKVANRFNDPWTGWRWRVQDPQMLRVLGSMSLDRIDGALPSTVFVVFCAEWAHANDVAVR